MALNYTKKTIDNFLQPKNIGSLNNPDGYAQIGNMVCGDQLDFFLKVVKGRIKDVKFLSFGCASNIATASVLTEKVKGMTIAEAKSRNWQEVASDLGGLPQQKIHCSVMAVEGLQKAIENYESRQKDKNKLKKKKNKLVKKKVSNKTKKTKQTVSKSKVVRKNKLDPKKKKK